MSTATTRILGISAYYHDSAAALVVDGCISAAAEEERFSRRKHDARFPRAAIEYCLTQAGLNIRDIDWIVFYDKPLLKFERLIETHLSRAPAGLTSFLRSVPIWLKERLHLKQLIRKELTALGNCRQRELGPILFSEHHRSHAASAFFPSPFARAAVVCVDGVGEWATTSLWLGENNALSPIWQLNFPHSLGLLYSAMTYFTGFEVNSGEYKLMGLAPYGEPKYVDLILENLIDLKSDGTFRMDMSYFDYLVGRRMTSKRMDALFGGPPRSRGAPITQREMDIARSVQVVTEEALLRLVNTAHRELATEKLCLAGGVALNCVANGRICREGPFSDVWIQPAAGDSGGAIGAALAVWHEHLGQPRAARGTDRMRGAFLGPEYSSREIDECLERSGARYATVPFEELGGHVAKLLAGGNVVGWFQGRMEFGPRALGKRSILGDPRSLEMQTKINQKTKRRESFRPFAPAALASRATEYFQMDRPSPYMMCTFPVREEKRQQLPGDAPLQGLQRLKVPRSEIAAVTHVDYSARVQTVAADSDPLFHGLIEAFGELTGVPVLLNTSFNVKDEPIVCTPRDALLCFVGTELDYLAIGNKILAKADQPASLRAQLLQAGSQSDAVPAARSRSAALRRAWMSSGRAVYLTITCALLGLVFVAVLTPLGLLRRALRVRGDCARRAETYRVQVSDPAAFSFTKPF